MKILGLECKFENGDGIGGKERRMGGLNIGQCIRACADAMKTDTRINGVTVLRDGKPGLLSLFVLLRGTDLN